MRRLSSQAALPWLLEGENPSVRYFALRDLHGKGEDDPEVGEAKAAILESKPVKRILSLQKPEGWWSDPEGMFTPNYRGSAWQLAFLAELGADPEHPKVKKGVEYVLDKITKKEGAEVAAKRSAFINVNCYLGVAMEAFIRLGRLNDERVQAGIAYACELVTQGKLKCRYRQNLSCPWGGEKEIRALARIPEEKRTPEVKAAMAKIAEFLLKYDLARAAYPRKKRVSGHWFRFAFPRTYNADILEVLDALALAGYGRERKLGPAIEFMLSKQDKDGRWKMETSYNGKMLADIEEKGKPSKWITLRALRVLKARYG
jgi:hypothetical protein